MNRCFFTGRTTKDIELRYTQEKNTAVAKFAIAVDSGWGDRKKTHFFNLVAFGKTAETLEKYVTKGTKIIVECQANQEKYTDRNGNNVNTVSFTVQNFEFAESKGADKPQNAQPAPEPTPKGADDFMQIDDSFGEELPWN